MRQKKHSLAFRCWAQSPQRQSGKTLFPFVHLSERDLGILEAGTDPGPQRGLPLGHRCIRITEGLPREWVRVTVGCADTRMAPQARGETPQHRETSRSSVRQGACTREPRLLRGTALTPTASGGAALMPFS